MGKKRSAGQPQQHATKSFTELVGEANRNALKPYIHEVFGHMANDLSRRVFRQQANIQTRIMAVEELLKSKLGVTQAEIEAVVANVEDQATGYVTATRPAKEGDLIRLSLRTKSKDQTEYSEVMRRQVTNLMNLGMDLNAQLSLGSKEVEGALVGMSTGEVKVVTLEDDFKVELTVERVSEKYVAAATLTNETPSENQNA